MTDSDSEKDEQREGLAHAWDWFAFHAKQRTENLNFFLVASAFLLSAYGYAIEKRPEVSFLLGIVGMLICVVFFGLERRNRQLVKAGEDALRPLEASLAQATNIPEMNIVANVERPSELWGLNSYGKLVPLAMGSVFV